MNHDSPRMPTRSAGKPRSAPGRARSGYTHSQHAGLVALSSLASFEYEGRRPDRTRDGDDGRSRLRAAGPPRRRPAEGIPGALNDSYDIPTVKFRHRRARGLVLTSLLIAGFVAWRIFHSWGHPLSVPLLLCVAPVFTFKAASWLLSWKDEPTRVSRRARESLDRFCVVVTVPVYNEDPALLDRCLYGLMNQSRPPQRIDVIDDGSKLNYSELKSYWVQTWPGPTEIRWIRQANQGKRRAHAVTFATAPEADIFVTVDSDTTLEHRALEEGLKPFIRRKVTSVAGIELGFNANVNFLTRMQRSEEAHV